MSASSSAQLGFLAPSASPEYGETLDDILQAAIVGICDLPGKLVRPRWQPDPPQQPAFDTDWCAFGVTRTEQDAFAYEGHIPAGNGGAGQSIIERDETLFVLHSFYGPNSHGLAERLRDGLEIAQNRATLAAAGVGLIEVGDAAVLPVLLVEKWVRRVDVNVVYRRRTSRTYEVRNLISAELGLNNERYSTPITVNNS
jgi:hypothetical protein